MKTIIKYLIAFLLLSEIASAQQNANFRRIRMTNIQTADTTSAVAGSFWYNPTVGKFSFKQAGGTIHIGSGGGVGGWATTGTTTVTTPQIIGNPLISNNSGGGGYWTNNDTTSTSRILWKINTANNSPVVPSNYYHSLNQGTIDSNHARDAVYSIGYNYLGGGRVNTTDAALRIGFESQYEGDTEFHIENITATGGVNRMLSFNSKRGTGIGSGYITTNSFDFRGSNTGVAYFSLTPSGGASIVSNTTNGQFLISASSKSIQQLFAASTDDYQINYSTNVTNDVGTLTIMGFNTSGTFKGNNTNFYRFYIDNTYNATNTASGLSFKLKSVEKAYIYASGSTRSIGDNLSIETASSATGILIRPNNGYAMNIINGGKSRLGPSGSTPTAILNLDAGTASANTAPLKFTSGTNLTTPEAGAVEYNGSNLFFSPGSTRYILDQTLQGSAVLDFPSTNAQLSADLTITVTGAADGDPVSLGVPNGSTLANCSFSAWVSAANTVTVRLNNYSSSAKDPASGTFKVTVSK